MKVIEVSGSARKIGRDTGEALGDEIRRHLEIVSPSAEQSRQLKLRLGVFVAAIKRHLPDVLEEMEGTAEGANLTFEQIARLNLPLYDNELSVDGCTNIVFSSGPDGPIWGKNNERPATEESRPVCCRVVRRDGAIAVAVFTFCGTIATLDTVNAEGLATGHSSVGSCFQQSDHHVPIRLLGYDNSMRCRTTSEFVRATASIPTRGKGYSITCVDREGTACSIEAPSPLMQVRKSDNNRGHIHCVNCYQLPTLASADRRSPDGKANARARWEFLDKKFAGDMDFGLDDMKGLLRHSDKPAICRNASDGDTSVTEYSMIALTTKGRVLFLEGLPCEKKYTEISI